MLKATKKERAIPVKSHDDMMLEIKGITALIYDSVMRLEDAFKSGNQKEKHRHLKNFYNHKNFFIGQVENYGFSICEKLKLYNCMYQVCQQILHHQRGFYQLTPIIVKATQHYTVRIFEAIEKLLPQVQEIEQIEEAIAEKKRMLFELNKLRHHYELVLSGVDRTRGVLAEQIKMLEGKLNDK